MWNFRAERGRLGDIFLLRASLHPAERFYITGNFVPCYIKTSGDIRHSDCTRISPDFHLLKDASAVTVQSAELQPLITDTFSLPLPPHVRPGQRLSRIPRRPAQEQAPPWSIGPGRHFTGIQPLPRWIKHVPCSAQPFIPCRRRESAMPGLRPFKFLPPLLSPQANKKYGWTTGALFFYTRIRVRNKSDPAG